MTINWSRAQPTFQFQQRLQSCLKACVCRASWVCIVLGVLVTIVGSIGGMRDIVRPLLHAVHADCTLL